MLCWLWQQTVPPSCGPGEEAVNGHQGPARQNHVGPGEERHLDWPFKHQGPARQDHDGPGEERHLDWPFKHKGPPRQDHDGQGEERHSDWPLNTRARLDKISFCLRCRFPSLPWDFFLAAHQNHVADAGFEPGTSACPRSLGFTKLKN